MKMTSGCQLKKPSRESSRRGAVIPLLALSLIPLMGMMAFSIDYGYLRVVKSDLQRAADAAALSAVIELVPDPYGVQDYAAVRATVREYAQSNMTNAAGGLATFNVLDADIEMGRYDTATIYGTAPVTLHADGMYDCLRVTLRRDGSVNGAVPLFFAKLLGIKSKPVVATATAILRRGSVLKAGSDILPFALPESYWDSLTPGEQMSIYNDNTITDEDGNQVTVTDEFGQPIPGNWGTVDIGWENNSSSDLMYQIRHGLLQSDLDTLVSDGRLTDNSELTAPVTFQADAGISIGIKDSVRSIHGETRIIPIYDTVNGELVNNSGTGNNAEFGTVKWGVVKVLDSAWTGNSGTYIKSQKAYTYDGGIIPNPDLTDKSSVIDGAYAGASLVR
ncbi:MAG: hypothetical protein HUJ26_04000 [Planctomycetaceae bacterium]|nr:hypothetical protein [Planctomycetaceae bacterium]